MKKTYSQAPISEVIIGLSYDYPKILVDTVLKAAFLSEEFPYIEIVPPLSIDILNGFQLQPSFNQNCGPFLIRKKSIDKKWLLQIQADRIYLNWIRLDTEPVGNYVGFSAIKNKFLSILANLGEILKVNLLENVALCELTYHDRLKWREEIPELSQINQIMDIGAPPAFSEQGYNNIFSRFTFHDFKIQGFGVISINTATAIDGEQLIKLESNLRGVAVDGDIDNWLGLAHIKQDDIFEKIFKEKIKQKWQ
jgi:uncharacterized protein (TIGR04255 family)